MSRSLHWTAWVVLVLVVIAGGWMAFDGARGLFADGFTGTRLGPWAHVAHAVGIEPRSTLMKLILATYGLCYLIAGAALILELPLAWWTLLGVSALGLWYLPLGTVINAVVIALLLRAPLRQLART